MEEKMKEPTDIEPIDYRVHETALARLEKINKRLFILCIIVFFAFVISNGAWIYYENQFEDIQTSVTQQVDSESGNEFSRLINGRNASEIWPIIDDLMDALIAINPRLYNSVLRKLE